MSRQYRQLPSADVPAELDRLVLRRAQEAVKARPAKSRAWVRWSGPLALAASAVLVISIVLESGVHKEAAVSGVPASAPVETQILRETAEQPVESRAAEPRAPEPAPIQPQFAPAPAEEPARSSDRALARKRIQPAAPPPAAAAQLDSPAPAMKAETPSSDLEGREGAEAAREYLPSVITTAQQREEDMSVEEVAVTSMRRPSIGNQEAARAIQGSLRGEQNRVAGPRNSVAAPAQPLGDADEQTDEPRSYSDPEQWLRDIRELRKDEKHDEADREWRRFRSEFPNYAVDENDPARGVR